MHRSGATWRLGGRVVVASAGDGAANGAVSSPAAEPLPDDIETLKAMLLAERSARQAAEKLTKLRELEIEKLKHRIAKLQHERFGQSSERRALLDQLELQLFELEEDRAQAETAEEIAAPPGVMVQSFERRSLRAGRCPSTCRASAWSIPFRRPARAAVVCCTSWARM